MILVTTILLLFTLGFLGVLIMQIRTQRLTTEELIAENHVRTRLYQDTDESTTFILSRTIQNISAGTCDPNLESDSFALKVVRELVKRKVPKTKWLEIQTNERLVHKIYMLLRQTQVKSEHRSESTKVNLSRHRLLIDNDIKITVILYPYPLFTRYLCNHYLLAC